MLNEKLLNSLKKYARHLKEKEEVDKKIDQYHKQRENAKTQATKYRRQLENSVHHADLPEVVQTPDGCFLLTANEHGLEIEEVNMKQVD